MAQQTDDETTATGVRARLSSLDDWALLSQRTPNPAQGDTSSAARLAAAMLDDTRKLRTRFGDQMLDIGARPEALRLHELLHLAERNALAAQRHGVESLTARLRNDDDAVREIAIKTFDRVEQAADALRAGGLLADELAGPDVPTLIDDTLAPVVEVDEDPDPGLGSNSSPGNDPDLDLDADRVSARLQRATSMRPTKPIPEQPATPSTDSFEYEPVTDWPAWTAHESSIDRPTNNRTEETNGATRSADEPVAPVELIAEPVVDSGDTGAFGRVAAGAVLEVLDEDASEKIAQQIRQRRALDLIMVFVLLALIALGLWLLLSGSSFVG